jgi:hypothetical protein
MKWIKDPVDNPGVENSEARCGLGLLIYSVEFDALGMVCSFRCPSDSPEEQFDFFLILVWSGRTPFMLLINCLPESLSLKSLRGGFMSLSLPLDPDKQGAILQQ